MPYDLKRSHFSLMLQKPVAAGYVVDREGVVLQSVLVGGEQYVKKADGSASTYTIAGFAVSDNETIGIIPVVEEFTIPASPGPYTIQLKYTNIYGTAPNASIRVNQIGSTDLTETASAGPSTGEFNPIVTTGVVTFHSDQAGVAIRVFYRTSLTVAQSQQLYFQRNVNNNAGTIFGSVVVGCGVGEIYTAEYDTNVDWSTAKPGSTGVINSGADGILTIGGSGSAIPNARCIHVPSVDQPYLGISFNI